MLVTEQHTIVCCQCGVERRTGITLTPTNTSFSQAHHIMCDNSYSRSKRFMSILECVVKGHASLPDNKMLEFLGNAKQDSLWCFDNVFASMRSSKLRDKRYNSMHLFNRIFNDEYLAPRKIIDWFSFRRHVLFFFEAVESTHRRIFRDKPFMSYTWLLHKMFTLLELFDYQPYIKILKCPKRTASYESNFQEITHELRRSSTFGGVLDVFVNYGQQPA